MRKFSFIVVLLTGIVAEQAFGQEVILPPVFEGTTIEEKAIKVFPSEDKSAMFIAIRVQASEGVSVFTFFDESAWKRNVDVNPFIPGADPDAKKQFASVFCAMNAQNFELACSSGQELLVVDNSKPWFIPVVTVRANELDTVVAGLTRRSGVTAHASVAPPAPPRGQGPEIQVPAMTPAPEQRHVPVVPYRVSNDRPQRQTIVWDDTPPPPPLPVPRVATDRR